MAAAGPGESLCIAVVQPSARGESWPMCVGPEDGRGLQGLCRPVPWSLGP